MRAVVGLALVFGAALLFWYAVSPQSFKAQLARARGVAAGGGKAPAGPTGRSPNNPRNQP